jgi:hypothetical protein
VGAALPRVLILHGTADKSVPMEIAIEFVAALKASWEGRVGSGGAVGCQRDLSLRGAAAGATVAPSRAAAQSGLGSSAAALAAPHSGIAPYSGHAKPSCPAHLPRPALLYCPVCRRLVWLRRG